MKYVMALLGFLFIGLKVTGHIAWSWLWVLAPFWIPVVTALVILLCGGAVFLKYMRSTPRRYPGRF